jgi:sulfate adenylyltransferase subunit 2
MCKILYRQGKVSGNWKIFVGTVCKLLTLLDAIEEFKFDACIGGVRRDEEKARAKERIFCS